MSKKPRWVNPKRQNILAELWVKYGNRCMYGHLLCPDITHYVITTHKAVKVATDCIDSHGKPKEIKCFDGAGNPIKDSSGNPLTKPAKQIIQSHIIEHSLTVPYEYYTKELIHSWVLDDNAEYKAEYEIRHKLYQRNNPLRGRFSGVSRDIYHDSQPQYYIEGYGIDGLTFHPFVKVRLASSQTLLLIDISSVLNQVSHNKRNKLLRYAKASPALTYAIKQCVNDYLK